VNLGLRFNHFNESVPSQSATAGNWVGARTFNAVSNVPNWNDIMPRVGLAYDLFGTGKTALKFGADKFVAQEALALTARLNPLSYQTDTRTWKDLDGNGSPFATGTFTPQLAEIGAPVVANFGSAASTPAIDPNLKRPYNWSYSGVVSHELLPSVSVTAGYYRRNFYKLYTNIVGTSGSTLGVFNNSGIATFNTAVSAGDYAPITITGPSSPSLPNGGGQPITIYNLTKTGATSNLIRNTSNSQHYDGFEVSMRGKLPKGGTVFGGVTVGRTTAQFCDVSTNPNDLRFCDHDVPFKGIYKLGWNYELPWQFSINGTYQQQPGQTLTANYTVTSAIAGTTLTGGSITIPLIDPAAQYLPAVKTLDLRVSKAFTHGRTKTKAFIDMINSTNLSTILADTTTFNASWPQPSAAASPRYLRLGMEFDF